MIIDLNGNDLCAPDPVLDAAFAEIEASLKREYERAIAAFYAPQLQLVTEPSK